MIGFITRPDASEVLCGDMFAGLRTILAEVRVAPFAPFTLVLCKHGDASDLRESTRKRR